MNEKYSKKVTLIIERPINTIHGKHHIVLKEEVTVWINPEEWKCAFGSCEPDDKDNS